MGYKKNWNNEIQIFNIHIKLSDGYVLMLFTVISYYHIRLSIANILPLKLIIFISLIFFVVQYQFSFFN